MQIGQNERFEIEYEHKSSWLDGETNAYYLQHYHKEQGVWEHGYRFVICFDEEVQDWAGSKFHTAVTACALAMDFICEMERCE